MSGGKAGPRQISPNQGLLEGLKIWGGGLIFSPHIIQTRPRYDLKPMLQKIDVCLHFLTDVNQYYFLIILAFSCTPYVFYVTYSTATDDADVILHHVMIILNKP